jgi:16S rRNA (adenine1518-N6/adenine1519-N6)-dimethyltransferase
MQLDEFKEFLKGYNIWPKKGLGQNFLVDENAMNSIIEAADLKKTDNIIEVGPGTGLLTEHLFTKAKKVVSVEYDLEMVKILKKRFGSVGNLQIVYSDALKYRIEDACFKDMGYKVVANIPYYITSPLIKHFLQSEFRPKSMVILVQKEVAEKICGITGKSLITIETQLFGKPEIVSIVPADSFYPAPKVNSAILKIEAYDKPLIPAGEMDDFLRVVKFGFSQKRKKLNNTLGAGMHIKSAEMAEILRKMDINPDLRPEDLEISDWRRLAKALTKRV